MNLMEQELVHDLYVLGIDIEWLAEFYKVTGQSIYKTYLKLHNSGRNDDFTLAQMSQVVSRFLVVSFTRNLHKMTPDKALSMLPDLLRVKSDSTEEEQILDKLVLPSKSPYESPEPEPDPED